MEMSSILLTGYLLFCGVCVLIVCKRCRHPLRAGLMSAAGGLIALGGVSLCGVAVPVNLYTLAASAVLGVPGVAGLWALTLV